MVDSDSDTDAREDDAATVDEPEPTVDRRGPGRARALTARSGERYRLGALIGRGGMGEVIGAIDEQLGREVAVKRMAVRHPTDRALERFFREASIQGRLDHPAIAPVYELGVDDDGRPFFTMKKLAGTTLAQRIAEDAPRLRLLRAFADVCLAIEFAHARGVIHRDLKPHNIVLGDFGEVYVLDWGVAKRVAEAGDDPAGDRDAAGGMTADGSIVGTRGYMAPEQARSARDVDPRADVFSLGCVLFEILAGEPLYPGTSTVVDRRPSSRAPRRDVPPELDALCVAATEPDRGARIETPRELGERVERFLDGDRDLAQRQQLAREHLAAARSAFAAGDGEAERRTAMREAGRALALDPKLAGAGELVGRLMLEPPREQPPEVRRAIEADNLDTLRRQARAGAYGYLGFLSFVPILLAGNRAHGWLALVLAALIAANVVLLLARWTFVDLVARSIRIALGNAALVLVLAYVTSPFFLAPGVAALVATTLGFSPSFRRARSVMLVGAALVIAVLVPWLAETAGWIAPTMVVADGGIAFSPMLLDVSAPTKQLLLVLYVIGLVGAAAGMALANRRAERSVRDRLALQAWQLRQLVS